MSSKGVGINHKEYGVTSTGVVKFAEIAMREQGIDIRKDPFSVKFTGGPNGDVAGNAMRILLERCPKVAIRLILDGTGALYDPAGADREELSRILLKEDLDAFDPQRALPGRLPALPERPQDRGAARAVPEGGADGSGGRGAVGHHGRVPPGVRRPPVLRAGGSLHPGRGPARDDRRDELGAVPRRRTARPRPG